MASGISMKDLEVKQAKAVSSEISMVGPRKLTFSAKFNKHLGIKDEDIGKESETGVGITMGFTSDKKYLVIYKDDNGGRKVGGSYKNPETYCADICKDILETIGKKLTGSGTVHFYGVSYETFEGTDTPVVLVELKKYSANSGVFATENAIESE